MTIEQNITATYVGIQTIRDSAVIPSYATPGAACFDLATTDSGSVLGETFSAGRPIRG